MPHVTFFWKFPYLYQCMPVLARNVVATSQLLAAHKAEWIKPISQVFAKHELFEMPPNGQGLASLLALGILGRFPLSDYPVDSAQSLHLQLEAMKLRNSAMDSAMPS